MQVSQELAETHYAIHKGKPFYEGLISYIISAPVMAMVWEGPNAVAAIRQTMGATRPTEAAPGSLRHDFAHRSWTESHSRLRHSRKWGKGS